MKVFLRAIGLSTWAAVNLVACGGTVDPTESPVPDDQDGDGYSEATGDCNDANAYIHPGVLDVCNGLDDDCDQQTDPGCDADGDGHLPISQGGADCDDSSSATNPDAPELCDGVDNNCDAQIDNAPDEDGDGYLPCSTDPLLLDCDDSSPAIHPGAPEYLDGTLNDCSASGQQELLDASVATGYLIGEYAGDEAGLRVAAAGDLNADGYLDLAIGAPGADAPGADGSTSGSLGADSGKVYLFFGGPESRLAQVLAGTFSQIDLSYADVTLWGEQEGDRAGSHVSGLGDVNGDSVSDVWVGAPGAAEGSGVGYVLLGQPTWPPFLSLADSDLRLPGDAGSALSVGAGGDLNGDGIHELVIAAPQTNSGAGAIFLVEGGEALLQLEAQQWQASALRLDGPTGSALGACLDATGDLQGDGFSELVIGAPGLSRAYLYFGRSTLELLFGSSPSVTLLGPEASASGAACSSQADLNSDGFPDVVIGAPEAQSGAGAVFVVYGKPSGLAASLPLDQADRVLEGTPGSAFGHALGGGPDLNGDGFDDLTVGAPASGQSFLLPGTLPSVPAGSGPAEAAAIALFQGATGLDAGNDTCLVGDMNDDGVSEWLIGIPGATEGGSRAGATALFLGY